MKSFTVTVFVLMAVLIFSSNALPLEEEEPMTAEDLAVPEDQVDLAGGILALFK